MLLPGYGKEGKIGIFDSGYGGLTVFREILDRLPGYDYVYLGDNARAPYGTRSFETIYRYTWQCVQTLFAQGCHLVILACNTASAKALRNIQLLHLPEYEPWRRVLGVIRPVTERAGLFSKTGNIGILATEGTVRSLSYTIEIQRFFPNVQVQQEACPMWVPLIENNEHLSPGAIYFVKKHLNHLFERAPKTDNLILACTHYPLLLPVIRPLIAEDVHILEQGPIVAEQLVDYLDRHPEIEERLTRHGSQEFFTTEYPEVFEKRADIFLGRTIKAHQLEVERQ